MRAIDVLCASLGTDAAAALFTRFVQSYAIHVDRLDPDMFDEISGEGPGALRDVLTAYEADTETPFPHCAARTIGRCAEIHGPRMGRHLCAFAASGQGRAA